MTRREALSALELTATGRVHAQGSLSCPARPIRVVVPFTPGGAVGCLRPD